MQKARLTMVYEKEATAEDITWLKEISSDQYYDEETLFEFFGIGWETSKSINVESC